MKNTVFNVAFDEISGGIQKLSFINDEFGMNFCKSGRSMSVPRGFRQELFEQSENEALSRGTFSGVSATTRYCFENDNIVVDTVLENENAYPVYFREGDIVLEMPLNDAYESSETCLKERCHAHVWTGLNNTYICAERMGNSEYNLGILFQKGSFSSYTQEECKHCTRGYFSLNASPFVLKAKEKYEIKYTLFAHEGGEDFFAQAKKLDGYVRITSPAGYTLTAGEKTEITIKANGEIKKVSCKAKKSVLPSRIENGKAIVSFAAKNLGENTLIFDVDGKKCKAVFNVIPEPEAFIAKRINFIVNKQQCKDKTSPLYGAYLIYDNEEGRQYFDYFILDQNANRERTGMPLTIVKWLQKHDNVRIRKSLDLFTDFLLRECVDEENGTCYGNIGKDESYLRLYNAPWVALYFCELYCLTKDVRWKDLFVRIVRYYYGVGGANFYPNGIRFYTFYRTLVENGYTAEADELYALYDKHVETIVKKGIVYPPHEVNFEQTIVTPAVSVLLDKYLIGKDEFYLCEAEKHLRLLRKFDGNQPHYRMNTVPIRYWDDYYFGKNGTYGDVFPHYWSVLSGYDYYLYYKATKKEEWLRLARHCMLNCFCNIRADGSATCAYVFPAWVKNGSRLLGKPVDYEQPFVLRKGAFSDAFANDQDFGLYFYMKMQYDLEEIK